MPAVIRHQRHAVAQGQRRDPEVVIRQDLALSPEPRLQAGVHRAHVVVKRKDEGSLEPALQVVGPLWTPLPARRSEQQFADRDEGESCDPPFDVAQK